MDEPNTDNPEHASGTGQDGNPDAKNETNQAASPDSNQDDKPKKPASPKAFDIFSPGKTTPPASGRPIIVSHKTMVQDTTVTGNQEILKQDNKEAGAPPAEPAEDRPPILNVHKKINLQPTGEGGLKDNGGDQPHDEHPAEFSKPEPPEQNDEPPESSQSSEHEPGSTSEAADESQTGHQDVYVPPKETGAQTAEKPPEEPAMQAFSKAKHADTETEAPKPKDDELLLTEHAGQNFEQTYQNDEQFNQFVVSHHKTARQKTLKKVGIIVVVVLIVAAVIGLVFWKMK